MKITFEKYPLDIIICIVWSLLLPPIALFDSEGVIRIVLGLAFILFIPGYVLIFALFPTRKTDKGINVIQRITLSFGFSIAVVPLIGLGLNYTTWGIRIESISLVLTCFVLTVGAIAVYRWFKTSSDKRFILSLEFTFPKSENKLERTLTILIVISIIIAIAIIVYVIVTPKTGEHFTEFYLLNSDHKNEGYQKNLIVGENAMGILGILNHEYKAVNYTIEIWLINQTVYYNESTSENQTFYTHMWFVDKMTTSLEHTDIDIEKPWVPQWESNYSFTVTRVGSFKLTVLLFTTPTDEYTVDEDYKDIAAQKISNAYRELHLWINIY
jgi:uncharacterized membrane protein